MQLVREVLALILIFIVRKEIAKQLKLVFISQKLKLKNIKNSSNENDTGTATPQIDNWSIANTTSASTPRSESAAIKTVNIESNSDFLYKSSDESGLRLGDSDSESPTNKVTLRQYSIINFLH